MLDRSAGNRLYRGDFRNPIWMQGRIAKSFYQQKAEDLVDANDRVPELDRIALVLLYILYEGEMNGKKILITGASGFIGGFLVEEALRRGY